MSIFIKKDKKRAALEKEYASVLKKETQLKQSAMKTTAPRWKTDLEKKVPEKVYRSLETAFSKAFSVVFTQGVGVIEKTYNRQNLEETHSVQDYAVQVKGNQTDKAEGYEILDLGGNETYADLGAYNGDTITEFLEVTGGQFNKIFAMEPDGKNYAKMKRIHYKLSPYDFRTVNAGAWSCDTVCEFISKGGRNSSLIPYEKGKPVNPSRIKEIEMRSLDSFVKDERITYIKYDVEGSESEALDGSKTVIKRDKPKLLVSLYHRTEDMFALPIKVTELNPSYKLYLRQHPYIPAWDMNLYCI